MKGLGAATRPLTSHNPVWIEQCSDEVDMLLCRASWALSPASRRECFEAAGEGLAEQLRRIVKRDCQCRVCRPARAALARWEELRREGEAG